MLLFFCFIFGIVVVMLAIIFALINASDKQRKIDRDSGYGLDIKEVPPLKISAEDSLDENCIEFSSIIYKNSKLTLAEAVVAAQAICTYIKEKKEPCKTSKHI